MTDKLKEAFDRVKQDIFELKQEINLLKAQIDQIYSFLAQIKQIQESNTFQQKIQHIDTSFFAKTAKNEELSLNFQSSKGNEGVPTDQQTNRQTPNRQPTDELKRTFYVSSSQSKEAIINNLKFFQRKFQDLTKQEFFIFSALYILSEKRKVTYKDIALKTNLSESSVRDYVLRLIKKGVPIMREKLNNKQILLEVPREFRELMPLDVLAKIRADEY
ncbi:MAG: winged helix-turn-helix domain-containing protein [Candidatus Pacearchaeota archaeon]